MAKSETKTKALFKKAFHYNWDNGKAGLQRIINDENCDKATALLIFWRAHPNYYFNHSNPVGMASYEEEMFAFLKDLAQDLLANKFESIISFQPEEGFVPEVLGQIPEALVHETKGRLTTNEVLYPNINPFEKEVMELCSNCDDIQKMYALEAQGANFNLKINNGYSTPISYACSYGQIPAIQYFLEKGFDLKQKSGKSPLFWSTVLHRNIPAIDFILNNGVKVNQKGEFGRTILHFIAGWTSEKQESIDAELKSVLTFLIEKGADIYANDSSKKTPFDLAEMWGNTTYIDFLNTFVTTD